MHDDRGDRVEVTQVASAMRVWRQTHPRATLTEIERELDRQLRAVRVAVLVDVVQAEADELGTCPYCGGRMVRRGTHERTLATDGDEALTLNRSYTWCQACESGLFPPR